MSVTYVFVCIRIHTDIDPLYIYTPVYAFKNFYYNYYYLGTKLPLFFNSLLATGTDRINFKVLLDETYLSLCMKYTDSTR